MISLKGQRFNFTACVLVISTVLVTQGCGERLVVISASNSTSALVAAKSGEDLYNEKCAACHDGPVARAPHKIVFPLLGPEHVLTSMNEGIMQAQAADLYQQEKIALAEYLGERPIQQDGETQLLFCEESLASDNRGMTGAEVKNWGMSLENRRSVSADIAGLSKTDVPRLDLKWAFAYPNAKQARSQPIVSKGEYSLVAMTVPCLSLIHI